MNLDLLYLRADKLNRIWGMRTHPKLSAFLMPREFRLDGWERIHVRVR
jgi:hypothetical protein